MTKEDLQTYIKLSLELTQLAEECAFLKQEMESPRSPLFYSQCTHRPVLSETEQSDLFYKLLKAYLDKWHEVMLERVKIEYAINSLPDSLERVILRYRYIQGLTWDKISHKIKYESAQLHRFHNRALENIQKF